MAHGDLPRRELLAGSAAVLGAAGLAGRTGPRTGERRRSPGGLIVPGDVVPFQGDSITDALRSREHGREANVQPALGSGYAWLAASGLLVDRPDDDLSFFNRGISGNKGPQLRDRWEEDCLALEPGVLSILVGANDYWSVRAGGYDAIVEDYERGYDALLALTRAALPEVEFEG